MSKEVNSINGYSLSDKKARAHLAEVDSHLSEKAKQTDLDTIKSNVSANTLAISTINNKLTDSGWINLTLLNGVAVASTGSEPQYRKIGNRVYLRGSFKNITADGVVIGNIPSGFRYTTGDSQRLFILPMSGTTVAKMYVNSSGSIMFIATSATHSAANSYFLDSVSYLID